MRWLFISSVLYGDNPRLKTSAEAINELQRASAGLISIQSARRPTILRPFFTIPSIQALLDRSDDSAKEHHNY
jgi:hypothetical protein